MAEVPQGPLEEDAQSREKLQQAMLSIFGGEAGGYTEVAKKTDKVEVRHDMRALIGTTEYAKYRHGHRPNEYLYRNILVPGLMSRSLQLTVSNVLFDRFTAEDKRADLDKDEIKREELAGEYDRAVEEIEARLRLTEKLLEQDVFAGDVEEYMVNEFLRLGKVSVEAKHYGTILNLPETYPGFEPYGKKVQRAVDLWRNVAKGNAVVDVVTQSDDGNTTVDKRRLPNVFALQKNTGLFDLVLNSYVAANIGLTFDSNNQALSEELDPKKARAITNLEAFDNRSAAITALFLVQHWDYDVEWGIGADGYTEQLTPQDLENLTLELAYSDAGKAFYFEARRSSEWRSKPGLTVGRREHPRVVGAPSTLGCYPRLSTAAPKIINTEVLAQNEDTGEVKKIKVSIDDAVWGEGRVTRLEGNHPISWLFNPLELGSVMWDKVEIFEADKEVLQVLPSTELTGEHDTIPLIGYALGVPSNAFEIPYKLQGFLAYKFIFAQVMRNDFLKQYDEIANSDLLTKMNKGIDNALGLLSVGYNLDEATTKKLNNYMRTVFLGGLASSVIKAGMHGQSAQPNLEQRSQVRFNMGLDKASVLNTLEDAARVTLFLNFHETAGEIKMDQSQKKLLMYIIENRKAPNPFELKRLDLEGWFSDQQLEKLRPLYPHITGQ